MSYDSTQTDDTPPAGQKERLALIEERLDALSVQVGRIARMATLTAARVEVVRISRMPDDTPGGEGG